MKAASARLVIHNLGRAGRAAAIAAPSTLAMLSQLPQQQAKADTISENDNEISLQEPIDYPGGHTQRQDQKHLKGEISGRSFFPAFL
jgi:hypothetical protein